MNRYATAIVIVSGLLRLIPHPFGITPIHSAGLFAGSTLPLKKAIPLFLVMLLVGDLVIGFYDFRVMAAVYAGALLAPLIGKRLIGQDRALRRVAGGVGVSALVFYLVSNFGNWLAFYPHTWSGFVANYIAGLPYLGIGLIGDGLYAVVLFGGYELLQRTKPGLSKTRALSQ